MSLIKSGTTVAAAALLAGCGRENLAEVNGEVAAQATPAEAPAQNVPATPSAAAIGGAPTADYMVGKWSAMPEDCSEVLDFRRDGTVLTPTGEAKWYLAGDKLTFDYGGSTQKPASIKVLSKERIEITLASGSKDIGKRC